jgi:hypothetical protein
MNRAILSLVAVLTLGSFACAAETHDDSFTKDGLFKADANKLTDTQLAVSPDLPLDPAKNVLWCGTLQLAWNELVGLVGEKPHFIPHSPAVDLLNESAFTRSDLDPASYVALADFERNHVEAEIRAALEKTFGGAASPELIPSVPPDPRPDDFVAYAYLYKNLAFADPFTDGTMTFAGQSIQRFGFPDDPEEKLTRQVQIYDYRSADDFIVSIQTQSPDDQLIFAKLKPGATLAVTIRGVLDRMAAHPPEAATGTDSFAVPKLNFDLRRHFHELEGLVLVPSPAAKIRSKLFISDAQQLVRFQLNEKGAVLKSEAVVVLVGAMAMPRHQLVFDKPFLILLKEKESPRPYFALWIGNPTLLVAAKADATN